MGFVYYSCFAYGLLHGSQGPAQLLGIPLGAYKDRWHY